LGNRKYGNMSFGSVNAAMISWGDKTVCLNTGDGKAIHAYPREAVVPAGTKGKGAKWQQQLPAGYQATAVIACSNAVVVSGAIYNQDANEAKGFVQLLSLDDGKPTCEQTFAVPLAYNGVAVAGGKIYASLTDGSVVCLGVK
jgi:outer membrane protein assembly factor BamB